MSTTIDAVATRLNELIETCKDGEEGYRLAAETVKNADLKKMFSNLSMQRRQFAGELQDMVRALDAAPEQSGTTAGAMHRGWMRLRAALTHGEEKAILTECERGEEAAVAQYQAALHDEGIAGELREMLELQAMGVKGAYEQVCEVCRHFGGQ